MKQFPIAAKIAGSIWILPCCVLNIGVGMFAQFVRPLLATILCVWEIWSGSNNRVYNVFHCLAKKKKITKKQHVTAPILKQTDEQKRRLLFLA